MHVHNRHWLTTFSKKQRDKYHLSVRVTEVACKTHRSSAPRGRKVLENKLPVSHGGQF